MLTLRKVAITGGLACGKSTVCDLLSNLGAYVISADRIVHQLLTSDASVAAQVVDLLGPTVLVDGQLDRSKIANAVFSHPELLKSLENILHPAVKLAIEAYYCQACQTPGYALFAAEIPLLFESQGLFVNGFDRLVCVVADQAVCRSRWGKNDFDERCQHQWPLHAKAALADIVIENSGDRETLERNVEALFHELATG